MRRRDEERRRRGIEKHGSVEAYETAEAKRLAELEEETAKRRAQRDAELEEQLAALKRQQELWERERREKREKREK
jgi:hypothetical protein